MGDTMTEEAKLVAERHDQDDGSITYEVWTSDRRVRVAVLNDSDNPNARQFAALFSASPDLLASIVNSDNAHWTTAMRTAIAKARARKETPE